MLPIDKKSSHTDTAIKHHVPSPSFQCRITSNETLINNNQNIIRRSSANYKPSIWDYDYIQSLSSKYKEKVYLEESMVLKEEVRMTLCNMENDVDQQLELIDVLQKLGIAYHFNDEISNILDNIYNNMDSLFMMRKKQKNLHATALAFRLLRQHGYHITTDVFKSFLDETGNFEKCESVDIKEMLALYEASFLSFEDETILDEARDFTSKFLKEYVNKNGCGHYISLLISHALLELPLHWRMSRWEAHWFIKVYEKRSCCSMSSPILQFAKLDFNIVQAIHQEELKHTSRWWKRSGFVKNYNFCRDRLVENFVWAMGGADSDPEYGYYRIVITKLFCLITTLDDFYDVYSTMEELELLTQVIDRWDQNYAMEHLPDYMKVCFLQLYNFVNKIALETLKKNGLYITPYLKKAWADLCKSYLIAARWYHNKYMPSLGEYLENAWISIAAPITAIHAYFLIPISLTKEDLVSLYQYPNIIRFFGMVTRIANDLVEREIKNVNVPTSIQCYMNETGVSESDAREHVKSMLITMWKKLNEEVCNSPFSQNLKDIIVGLARATLFFYQNGDEYTFQDVDDKSGMISLVTQPIM